MHDTKDAGAKSYRTGSARNIRRFFVLLHRLFIFVEIEKEEGAEYVR